MSKSISGGTLAGAAILTAGMILVTAQARAFGACCAPPAAPASAPTSRSASGTASRAETCVVTLRIPGRTCAACDSSVARALREVPGVRSVRFEGDTVTVAGSQCPSKERLVEAVRHAGGGRHAFRVEAVEYQGPRTRACDLRGCGRGVSREGSSR